MRPVMPTTCVIARSVITALSAPAWAEFRSPFWISGAGHDAEGHHVAAKDGDAVFIWNEGGAVKGRTLSSKTVLGPFLHLAGPDHPAYAPQVAMDHKGNALTVWNTPLEGTVRTRRL